MRTTRIYYPGELFVNQQIVLHPEASAHLLRVLRLPIGVPITLFNGSGNEYAATLIAQEKKLAHVEITSVYVRSVAYPFAIHLGQGISRGAKIDFTLQKAVELGVTSITPLFTEYSTVKLTADRLEKRLAHWRGVIISACEQSGRTLVPNLATPMPLDKWVGYCNAHTKLILHPRAARKLAELPQKTTNIALLIGAEGGFSDHEVSLAQRHHFISISLGPRILRTETAGLAAISALQSKWGDMS